ncbi:Pathogenesis-related 1 [Pyrrhoderma noxium]|uniref:Pathogenesis-related 1 n=1 Tax=Pyrrhoderma noxium TaxID=2282107 RepID=A0A286UPF4_9AGAM|nr:Pathogenesis-related 1 [Pyrrhoderma noxium]
MEAKVVRPFSQSPWPAWSLGSIFLASSAIPPNAFKNLPPFPQRAGFSLIMFGAVYVTSTGDVSNGSGISTAWCLTYLFWNGRRSLTAPRNPVSLFLTGATALCTGLYGTEYFVLQGSDD